MILGPQDAERLDLPLEIIAARAVEGGADLIQLRDKHSSDAGVIAAARRMRDAVAGRALFIVNDRVEAALESGADGVHLGQDDRSIAEARAAGPAGWIVGKSTHSLDQARSGAREADYIGFGPVFATPTKPDYAAIGLEDISTVAREIQVPFFAIGGVDASNLDVLRARGARRVAVVRAATRDGDVVSSVRKLKERLIDHD